MFGILIATYYWQYSRSSLYSFNTVNYQHTNDVAESYVFVVCSYPADMSSLHLL